MSFKENTEITGTFSLFPQNPTLHNYAVISVKIYIPLIASGIGVAAFFNFMFSWVELLIARTLTTTDAKPIAAIMTRTVSASGMDWGVLAAAGVLTIIPGAIVISFVRNYIAKGFALGRVQWGEGCNGCRHRTQNPLASLDSEVKDLSVLSRADQEKEMQWFIDAAKPFAGMDIKVVSETITAHEYESKVLAPAFYAQFVTSKTVDLKKSHTAISFVRQSSLDDKSFTERAPKLGGLVEFYRSPARLQWSPTGTNVPDDPKLAQLWWQAIGDASSGAKTAQEAMDSLCAEQEKVMGRIERSGIQGGIGPKLAEEHDLEYWNEDAVSKGNLAPQLKIENEKEKPQTINYDDLVKSWQPK